MTLQTGVGFGAFLQEDGSVLIGKGCDGVEIPRVSKITVKLAPDEVVTALIEVAVAPETIAANPMLSKASLIEAAAFHGLELVAPE